MPVGSLYNTSARPISGATHATAAITSVRLIGRRSKGTAMGHAVCAAVVLSSTRLTLLEAMGPAILVGRTARATEGLATIVGGLHFLIVGLCGLRRTDSISTCTGATVPP